ncbi:hypothetical protein DE146DRAFT_651702 [Phaeosphaeria sp. MPI-PUGE-AT-0046c]|nr:hypothetical protein DE146DRAFT_651702 [Phaeosphaeria sp. MPI-PUGE-AT-0046c]
MTRDTAAPASHTEKSKEMGGNTMSKTEEADAPKKFKQCPVCKADSVPINPGGLDGVVEDKYNQLIPAPNPPLEQHADFKHCVPPEVPQYGNFSLFTAGSIEMGAAVQWQQRLAQHLCNLPITITNPRRGRWDPNVNAKREDPQFFSQVEWELDALTNADVICYFFDCSTVSPVTLMELGLWAHSGKIIVCCDQRYWRQGNVEIVCERYGIPYVSSFEKLVPALKVMMEKKGLALDSQGNYCGAIKEKKGSEERPGASKDEGDKWWLEFRDSNEDRAAKGLAPLKDLESR